MKVQYSDGNFLSLNGTERLVEIVGKAHQTAGVVREREKETYFRLKFPDDLYASFHSTEQLLKKLLDVREKQRQTNPIQGKLFEPGKREIDCSLRWSPATDICLNPDFISSLVVTHDDAGQVIRISLPPESPLPGSPEWLAGF